MSDIVYPLQDLFSLDPKDGVLGQNQCTKFYIAPYQRGYKWACDGPNPSVSILMKDLLDAFHAKDPEYYLQYITVKKSSYNGESVLEVIDGQQRITTLTLLFNVISHILKSNEAPVSHAKLVYGIRPKVAEFLAAFDFKNLEGIIDKPWKSFLEESSDHDEQDIYFLYAAMQKMHFELKGQDVAGFSVYLLTKVLVIVNVVDKDVVGERIFRNLNSNKVDLTGTELLKGLLLTTGPRQIPNPQVTVSFKELTQRRNVLGKQWDTMVSWVNKKDVGSFYFGGTADKMGALLEFLAVSMDASFEKGFTGRVALFDFFHTKIKSPDIGAGKIFASLKGIYETFRDWYGQDDIYNAIGFLSIALRPNELRGAMISWLGMTKTEMKDDLKTRIKGSLPKSIEDLDYNRDSGKIRILLLAINSVAAASRFDFFSFKEEKWTLEHIFPRNPNFIHRELTKEDLQFIREIGKDKLAGFDPLSLKAYGEEDGNFMVIWDCFMTKLASEKCTLDNREKELLVAFMRSEKLDAIGNLALLTHGDNSSNSNGMFDRKRHNLVSRISKGSFVPHHTFIVFSKLISSSMNPNLRIWSERDIRAHFEWIKGQHQALLN